MLPYAGKYMIYLVAVVADAKKSAFSKQKAPSYFLFAMGVSARLGLFPGFHFYYAGSPIGNTLEGSGSTCHFASDIYVRRAYIYIYGCLLLLAANPLLYEGES